MMRTVLQYSGSLVAPLAAPRKRFVIFCPGRVGSELLVQLVDDHPGIACDAEILSARRALPNRFVEFRAARRSRGVSAYGFKLIAEQLRFVQPIRDPRAWLEKQAARGTLITLERRDLLRQAISFTRAREIGWHHHVGAPPPSAPLWLDPAGVLAHLYVLEESLGWFGDVTGGLPALRLCYEDDLETTEAQQRTVDRIAELLGLPSYPVSATLVRSAPPDLHDAIANYGELEALLRKTRFAPLLEVAAEASKESKN